MHTDNWPVPSEDEGIVHGGPPFESKISDKSDAKDGLDRYEAEEGKENDE